METIQERPYALEVRILVLAALLKRSGKSIDRTENRDKLNVMFRKIEQLRREVHAAY